MDKAWKRYSFFLFEFFVRCKKKSKNRKFATQRRNVAGVVAVSGREIVFFVLLSI